MKKVVIVGAGSIGTALGQTIARQEAWDVTLLSIEKDVVEAINTTRFNTKYFPNIKRFPEYA